MDFQDSKINSFPDAGDEDEKKRGADLDIINEPEEVSKWEMSLHLFLRSKVINEHE